MSERRYYLLVFIGSLLLFCATLNSLWATDHTSSLLHLDFAIWKYHSFALGSVGNFTSNSVDDFVYRGHYYTALAPGSSLLALPFVIPGFVLDGGYNPFGYANLLSELFVALMNSVAVLMTYRMSRLYFDEGLSSFLAFAYGFSTISWPFATFFFQNDVSAAFALISVYLIIRLARRQGSLKTALVAGLALGAATIADYVSAILVLVLLGFLGFSWRHELRRLATVGGLFLVGASQGFVAIALYNLASFGSAFVTSEQLYLHSGSPLGNFSTPVYLGVILNLFTPLRGLLVYSPIVAFGFLGYRTMLVDRASRSEGVLLFASFLALFLPYCAWYGPEGGASFGPRFVIASLPYLLVPAGFVFSRGVRWWFLGYFLYAIGTVENGLAALTSAIAPNTGWLTSPFLDSTLPAFERGVLDPWWIPSAGANWPIPAGLIVGAALLFPMVARDLRRRRPPSRKEEALAELGSHKQAPVYVEGSHPLAR